MSKKTQLKAQNSSTAFAGPEPDAYDEKLFTNREKEIQLVKRKVDEGRYHQPIIQPLVHFWGVMGIGKSWLLQWLFGSYRFTANGQEPGLKLTFATLFDFGEFVISLWQPSSVVRFLKALIEQIREQIEQDAEIWAFVGPQLEDFDDNAQDVLTGKGEVNELAERFVQIVNRLSQDLVPVLLFDTAEKLDGDVFFWLESHILEPILRQDRSVVVIAGRKEIPRWREFGTRQRLVRKQLQPFDEKETAKMLERRGVQVAEDIFFYTFGHPYAIQVLAQATKGQEFVPYLAQVEARFFLGIRPDQQAILRILSTVRKFNIESTRYLLKKLLGDEYGSWSDVRYLRLLESLEDTNLVWWETGQRGYVLDYTVRRILNRHLQLQKPTEFVRRHGIALELYRRWIREYAKGCGPFVREALYHLGQMWLGSADERKQEYESQANTFLEQVLNDQKIATIDEINELWLSLRDDEEIQETGLRSFYQPILERIRDLRNARATAHEEPTKTAA